MLNQRDFDEDQCHQRDTARKAQLREDMSIALDALSAAEEEGMDDVARGIQAQYDAMGSELADLEARGW